MHSLCGVNRWLSEATNAAVMWDDAGVRKRDTMPPARDASERPCGRGAQDHVCRRNGYLEGRSSVLSWSDSRADRLTRVGLQCSAGDGSMRVSPLTLILVHRAVVGG